MIANLIALGTGALFAAGLAVSGMTVPTKVIGFLDVAGAWDPTLALVMAGAVSVFTVAFAYSRRMARPVAARVFLLPQRGSVDARLLLGSALFGAGWGLAGYCPGPALVSTATGAASPLAFSAAMIAAFWATRKLDGRFRKR